MDLATLRGVEALFRSRIDTSGEHHVWTGPIDKFGDLRFSPSIDGKQRHTHARRAAYQLNHGVLLPRKQSVTASCGEPKCVRPEHLMLVSERVVARKARIEADTQAKKVRREVVWGEVRARREAERQEVEARKQARHEASMRFVAPTPEELPLKRSCITCQQEKDRESFPVLRKGNFYQLTPRCSDCVRTYTREFSRQWHRDKVQSPEGVLQRILASTLKTAKRKGRAHDLTIGFLRDLWAKQGGCCAVTGLPFQFHNYDGKWQSSPYLPSPDRIDCSRGYTMDNVRLVCLAVNVAIRDWGVEAVVPIFKAMVEKAA